MSRGWISIHRQLQSHWLWEDKPFSKGQAWIDLLLLANHEDTKFLLGNDLIEAKRGEVITSELKLMERWGWSKTKVRSFLELLQKDLMIVKKADRKKTALIIVKYDDWQDSQTTEKPEKNRKETNKKPRKDTINNNNNLNNNIYTPEFDSFWDEYPRKESKPAAFKTWNARLKEKYNPTDLIQSAKNYAKKTTGKEVTFIKLPSTFLGPDRHFEDYLTIETPNNVVSLHKPMTNDEMEMEELHRRLHGGGNAN